MKYSEYIRARCEEMRIQKGMKDRGEDPRAVIPTGLREFDKRAGVKRGIMTLVGASTGEGKDLWALHLMTSAAQHGYSVEVLSMEDPAERTVDRSLSRDTGINNARMLNCDLDERELGKRAVSRGGAPDDRGPCLRPLVRTVNLSMRAEPGALDSVAGA